MSSARGFFDADAFEVDCPDCGSTVKTTVRAARRRRSVRCPAGHTVQIEGSHFDRSMRRAEKSLDKMFRS